ncbi:MAG: hypothetical protein QW734_07690 [Candidatus Bathyarchaeia archaeon]
MRGAIGYWLVAEENEAFSLKKLAKTVTRYALFNLAAVNLMALSGVQWTVTGVIIFTLSQLAMELGFDLKEYVKT